MAALELSCKAFLNRHQRGNEKFFEIGKVILVFQTCNAMGKMPRKLRFLWTGLYWIISVENDTFKLDTLVGEILQQKVNDFRLKSY